MINSKSFSIWDFLVSFLVSFSLQKNVPNVKKWCIVRLSFLLYWFLIKNNTWLFQLIKHLNLYGSRISWILLIICFPTIMIPSCCDNSHKQPLLEHLRKKYKNFIKMSQTILKHQYNFGNFYQNLSYMISFENHIRFLSLQLKNVVKIFDY